jgi:D-alanyl-D-alanine endopeptidase (penicillin-binding protein 7)
MRSLIRLLLFSTVCSYWQPATAYAESVPITATSWLVADGNGKVIESKNANEQRSIASITKLMTAMIVLDANQDLTESINGVTRSELITRMLVKSDNIAANILCDNYPGGHSSCISAMNLKARSLGLTDTHYVDPSGLNIMNVSTATELLTIVITASKYHVITEASNTYEFQVKHKKHWVAFHNTNPLVATQNFIVTKTGYIKAAGGCIVMMLDTKIGQRIVVLLNSKNTHTRIPEAQQLALGY